jgi:hypothetical protein
VKAKIFMVARPSRIRNKTEVFGFVTCFGWENADQKAAKKYPEQDVTLVQEFKFPWARRK